MAWDETTPEDGDGQTSGTKISELPSDIRALKAAMRVRLDGILSWTDSAEEALALKANVVTTTSIVAGAVTAGKLASDLEIKAWVNFDGTATAISMIRDSYNVSSITDNGTGQYTINWDTDFANDDYTACISAANNTIRFPLAGNTNLVGSIQVQILNAVADTYADSVIVTAIAIGDQ